ncbi:ABC transporter permease [Calorimonas adulescens]|uniref:ABC transporter permease n=1 Tax=Calorimonas adulescens TaxID=2606906 RepID=A0A5D8QDW8_9THEO|nr:ABC transporter permease [Calorimonas adulescens]TZE82890.1 ABC transporter permease [Calorimonas adulescens]
MQGLILLTVEQGLAFSVMALGVYISFRILNYADLSVDGTFPLGAATSASLISAGVDPYIATLAALFAGMAAGAVTGLLNTKAKISELLSGILTMTALYSINLRIMGKSNLPLLNERLIITGEPYNALMVFGIILVILIVLLYVFFHTEIGMAVRALGSNPKMLISLGINTDGLKVLSLSLSNGLVALSGSLIAQYQGFADVGMGIGTIVIGLASVIIGEMLIGGSGILRPLISVAAGSIIYRMAISMAMRAGMPPTDLKLVTAVGVILILTLPQFKGIARFKRPVIEPAGKVQKAER